MRQYERGNSVKRQKIKAKKRLKAVKRAFFPLLLLSLLLAIGGCAQKEQGIPEEQTAKTDRLRIGMSFDSFVIERWIRDRDFFTLTAKNLGAEVNVQGANGEVEEQISQIRYFIKKKMDVIVVIAVDSGALSEVVEEAKKEGIRVIAFDRPLTNVQTDLYISFDNEMVGALMAEAFKEALPEGGNIFMINGSPTDNNVAQVGKGFYEGIEGSSLEIVYTAYCENWLAELAFDAVEEGLSTTPRNLAGVMCGNDDLAGQAFRALAENRLAGKVVLVGQDADLAACQRIVEGTQTMTVYKPVETLAKTAAEFAAALGYEKMEQEGRIAHEDIPKTAAKRLEEYRELPYLAVDDMQTGDSEARYFSASGGAVSGGEWRAERNEYQSLYYTVKTEEGKTEKAEPPAYRTPYYSIEPVAVTAENIDEVIIGSDFHTEEDVYLNTKESQ